MDAKINMSSAASSYSSFSDGGLLVQNLTDKPWFLVQGLRPYRNYTFTVVVRAGGAEISTGTNQQELSNNGYTSSLLLRRSVPVSGIFSTLEWVPGRCTSFQAIDVQPGHLTLEWTLPESEYNGVLLRYVITWTTALGFSPSSVVQLREEEEKIGGELISQTSMESELETQETPRMAYFEPWRNRATIKNLVPGRQYIFNISGETRIGRGSTASLEQRMPILGINIIYIYIYEICF